MLGMVTPQMVCFSTYCIIIVVQCLHLFNLLASLFQLQMVNIRQASGQPSQSLFNQGQQVPSPAVQNIADLAPPAENRLQSGLMPKMQDSPFSSGPQNLLVHSQFPAPRQQNMQPRMQLPQHANHNVLQHATLLGQAGIPTLPPMHPQSSSGLSIRPQTQVASSSLLNQKMQPPLSQHPGQVGVSHLGHNTCMIHQNATVQESTLSRPFSDAIFQVPNFPCVFPMYRQIFIYF